MAVLNKNQIFNVDFFIVVVVVVFIVAKPEVVEEISFSQKQAKIVSFHPRETDTAKLQVNTESFDNEVDTPGKARADPSPIEVDAVKLQTDTGKPDRIVTDLWWMFQRHFLAVHLASIEDEGQAETKVSSKVGKSNTTIKVEFAAPDFKCLGYTTTARVPSAMTSPSHQVHWPRKLDVSGAIRCSFAFDVFTKSREKIVHIDFILETSGEGNDVRIVTNVIIVKNLCSVGLNHLNKLAVGQRRRYGNGSSEAENGQHQQKRTHLD